VTSLTGRRRRVSGRGSGRQALAVFAGKVCSVQSVSVV